MSEHAVSRRAALKTLSAGAGAITILPWLSDEGLLAFSNLQKTGAKHALKVLSTSQYATLELLVEAIIPADERSPGAKEARVADYVDLLLSESDAELKSRWIDGLAALDTESTTRFGAPFAKIQPAQLETLLTDVSKNEKAPQTPVERFFVTTKQATIHGYYTSEIGIHKELKYPGNQFVPEFLGCQTEDGKDCPHCGQKATPKAGSRAEE